ncbi:hypothetical protein MMC28_009184 [Mycoblastus sanguinarius]|nr:hypothetical protein [Mycoblastus sanguinarius]
MEVPPGVPLDQLPGLDPPPGVTPDFVNPDNYQSTIIATMTVCLTVATLITALRLYTRLFIIKSFHLEDYASCAAWAGLVLSAAVEITYSPVILAAKLAILLQLMHIFVTSRNTVRFYLVQLLIWINVLWYLIQMFMTAFQCLPRAKIWNPMIPGHCVITFYTINFMGSTFNVVSDLFILILPILWVWKLQMVWKRKLGVSLIFATGILACLSSIMRLVTFHQSGKHPDQTWYLGLDGLWTLAEITCGIICGSLPTLPRGLAQFSSKISYILSSYRSSRPGDSENSQPNIRRALGIKKASVTSDHSNDYIELTNQSGGHGNPHTFLESKASAERSELELKSAYSAV